ncbi:hypothetical protein BDR22DRAFT_894853 [Usnea florida]
MLASSVLVTEHITGRATVTGPSIAAALELPVGQPDRPAQSVYTAVPRGRTNTTSMNQEHYLSLPISSPLQIPVQAPLKDKDNVHLDSHTQIPNPTSKINARGRPHHGRSNSYALVQNLELVARSDAMSLTHVPCVERLREPSNASQMMSAAAKVLCSVLFQK